MKLRLTDYSDNACMDPDVSCELCMYAGFLDHREFQFTGSDGGVRDISGWGLFNVRYNVNVPLFAYWLHDAEFKELGERGLVANEPDLWGTALVGVG